MPDTQSATELEPPSSARLIRSTLLAGVAAGALLVLVVLPQEYGISPADVPKLYGIGGTIAAETVSAISTDLGQGTRRDEIVIRLRPGQSAEVKLDMRKGDRISYAWWTDGGGVNFNAHGDPADAGQAQSHRYGAGQETAQDSGDIEAVFDGQHGWYWKNRTDGALLLTVQSEGAYSSISRVE